MSLPTLQLQCPACGQNALAPALHPMQLWRCPHCAYGATAEHFVILEPPVAAVSARRRDSHRFGPSAQAQPSLNPNGWHIQTYQPISQTRFAPSVQTAPLLPIHEAIGPADERDWLAAQAYVESHTAPLRRTFASEPQAATAPEAPAPRVLITSSDWSPMKPAQAPKLTPWPGLAAEYAGEVPSHLRGRASRLWLALLSIFVVGGGAVAMILTDRQRNDQVAQLTRDLASATTPAKATPQPLATAPVARVLPPESKLGLKETESLAEALLQRLLKATTDEQRLACIAEPKRHRDSLHEFFAAQPQPLTLQGFRALPAAVSTLPGNYPVTLCEARTSFSARTTAITRLVSSDDGSLKLDWPLLLDSLENQLANYAARPSPEPRWVMAGLKRNFGFSLPERIRASHHVFDIQCSGNGTDRTLVLLPKDSPTGRAFDSTLAWNDLYIVRTLLHWSVIDSIPMLTMLDGELMAQE